MFFLLYEYTDDAVFDDFPKISVHFPKISEDFPKLSRRPDERSRTFSDHFRKFPKMSEDCRRLPKTFEEDPKMFWWYTNEFKYNVRENLMSLNDMTLTKVTYGKYAPRVPDEVAYGIYEWFSSQ